MAGNSVEWTADSWQVVGVVAGGHDEGHTVIRRSEAPEKIRIVRTEGSNSGELERKAGELLKWAKEKGLGGF